MPTLQLSLLSPERARATDPRGTLLVDPNVDRSDSRIAARTLSWCRGSDTMMFNFDNAVINNDTVKKLAI